MLFLPFWLAGWTAAGIAAITAVLQNFSFFMMFWLGGWAVGWLFAVATLLWMLTGYEILSVQGRDLEVVQQAAGIRRRWLYQGSQIANLSVAPQPPWPFQFRWQIPFFRSTKNGAIKFNYGSRTNYLGAGLDEAEAEKVVALLNRKLL